MDRSRKIIFVLSTVLALLAAGLFGTAWAQTQGSQGMMVRSGSLPNSIEDSIQGSCSGDGSHHEIAWQSLANSLGMTASELKAQVKEGAALSEIAAAKRLSSDQLDIAVKTAIREMMNQHVTSGDWDQEDADAAFEGMMGDMTPADLLDMLVGSVHGGIDMSSMHAGGMGGIDMDSMHAGGMGGIDMDSMHAGGMGGMHDGASGGMGDMMGGDSEGGCHGSDDGTVRSSSL